jgi:hypothetical protein
MLIGVLTLASLPVSDRDHFIHMVDSILPLLACLPDQPVSIKAWCEL